MDENRQMQTALAKSHNMRNDMLLRVFSDRDQLQGRIP